MNKKTENKAVSPWQWVPSLYFAQGLPYVVVMSVAVILFKRMGMSNTDIALYTSGLNLPWVIKPNAGGSWSCKSWSVQDWQESP